jgi:hypothetical protein
VNVAEGSTHDGPVPEFTADKRHSPQRLFSETQKETSMSTIVAHHKVKGVLPETVVVCIEA